jgi:hypothetical protein
MLAMVARSGTLMRGDAVAEELDELVDDALLAEHLVTVRTRSVAVVPSGSLPLRRKPMTSGVSM